MEAGLALGSTAAVIAFIAAGIAARPEDENTAAAAVDAAQAHLEAVKAKNNKPAEPGGEPPQPPPLGPKPVFSTAVCEEVFRAIERGTSKDLANVKKLFTADPTLALCKKNGLSTWKVYRDTHFATPPNGYG
jgi:hypothetical protein